MTLVLEHNRLVSGVIDVNVAIFGRTIHNANIITMNTKRHHEKQWTDDMANTIATRVFGTHDENTLKQLEEVSQRAVRTALMADGHKGYIMPVGGVAAYRNEVSVPGVGVDIGCGNCAIRTDKTLTSIGKDPDKISWILDRYADEIADTISFGIGRKNQADDAPTDHPLFNDDAWNAVPRAYRNQLFDKAVSQLGTVGSGNHYVDVFVDGDDRLWVGVHFGSRGLGFTIANAFSAIGQGGQWGDRAPEKEVILSLLSTAGQEYWALMNLAGQYAYAGREWVTRKVVSLLGANEVEMVHNHHNFAWKETQYVNTSDREELVVVRKGATPAFPGQKGFVGGSMGDDSVILEGSVQNPDNDPDWNYGIDFNNHLHSLQNDALYSTVHGAGRVMSRTAAKGKTNRKTGQLKLNPDGTAVKAGLISRQEMNKWLRRVGVHLRGGDVDESPQAYRRLDNVLTAQGNTIKVLHRLKPLIVCMAGNDIRDPYKD